MGWLEDAQKKLAELERTAKKGDSGVYDLDDSYAIEQLKRELMLEYTEISEYYIDKAISEAKEQFKAPYDKKELEKFFRNKLEY